MKLFLTMLPFFILWFPVFGLLSLIQDHPYQYLFIILICGTYGFLGSMIGDLLKTYFLNQDE